MSNEIACDAGPVGQGISDLDSREIAIVLDGDTIVDVSGPCAETLSSSREELIGESLSGVLSRRGEDGHEAFESPCAGLLLDSRVFPITIAGRRLEVLMLTFASPDGSAVVDRGFTDDVGRGELLATLRDIASAASTMESLCHAALAAMTADPALPWARSLAFLLLDEATGDLRVVAQHGLHFDAGDPDNPFRVPLRAGSTTTGYLIASRMDGAGVDRQLEFLTTLADTLAVPLHQLKLEAANAAMEERIGTLLLELQHVNHVVESASRMRNSQLDDLALDVHASVKAVVTQAEIALSGDASTTNRLAVLERLRAESDRLESIADDMIMIARPDEGTPGQLSKLHDCYQCQASARPALSDQ